MSIRVYQQDVEKMLYVVVMHVTSQAISSGLLTADRDLNKEVNFLWYDPNLPNEISMNLLAGGAFSTSMAMLTQPEAC